MSPMYVSPLTVCKLTIILVSLMWDGVGGQTQDGYRQAVGCFSNIYNNFLELSCADGEAISVKWVIFGTHPDVSCPTDGSLGAEQAHCCVPQCGDCVVENERESENVFSCNNKRECSVWTRTTWVDGCSPMTVTTYMMVLYKCNNNNNTTPETSVASVAPSFNHIHCGHQGASSSPLSPTPSPTVASTPAGAGPRKIIGCYSSFHKQKIEIKCQRGEGIAIYGVFFAARSNNSCPVGGFIETPEQTVCCVPACGDCVITQSNEASYIYRECSGEKECSPWTHRILISDCGLQEYTSYMVVHYECLRDFKQSIKSKANGMSFEELFGCPLPSTTPTPTTPITTTTTPTTRRPITQYSSLQVSDTHSTTLRTTTPSPATTTTTPTTTLKNYDGTYVAIGCYSNIFKPKVQISCSADTHILIHGVFFGTRQVAVCPESGLIEEGSEECCEPRCGDCVSFGGHGEVNNLLKECTYQEKCSVWTQRSTITPSCGNKSFTAYMAVHYQCTQAGMDVARPMSFDELFCPPGSHNISRSTRQRPTLFTTATAYPTAPSTAKALNPWQSERLETTVRPFTETSKPPTSKATARPSGFGPAPGNGIHTPYPGNSPEEDIESRKVLIGAVVGGVATVLLVGITLVVILHLRRSREKTVVTRGHSLDPKRKRKRNHSKNHSQCTNSTHLNSVAPPSNLTMINVISNSGRLPGKGDYNHLERWLGDLETSGDNFDLPRISEVSESDTDADIESRVRKISTFPHRPPDILQESDS